MATSSMPDLHSSPQGARTAFENYTSMGKQMSQESLNTNSGYKPKLERGGSSMPRLMERTEDVGSRRSGLSGLGNHKLNASVEMLKPLKAERSLMKVTGAGIMGQTGSKMGDKRSTVDYGIAEKSSTMARSMRNPYGSIEVADMIRTTAKAQYEGSCSVYPVPDTQSKLYKIHG